MGFSQSLISSVNPPLYQGAEVFISWQTTADPGTWFQCYANGNLVWWGRRTWTRLPAPPVGTTQRIDIGTVDPGEQQVAFNASVGFGSGGFGVVPFGMVPMLPSAPSRRVTLSWQGGYNLGTDLAGFHVYSSQDPGEPVDYATPVATIAAYPGGIDTSGFGLGGFGDPGFGVMAGDYAWTSGTLASGVWNFAIVPYDAAGNAGTAMTTTATVAAPPGPPGLFADGMTRLEYSLEGYGETGFGDGGFGLPAATLTWNASNP